MGLYNRMWNEVARVMTTDTDSRRSGVNHTIYLLVMGAKTNADDTLREYKFADYDAEAAKFEEIFKGSLIDYLSNDEPDYTEAVHAWFANFGVKA